MHVLWNVTYQGLPNYTGTPIGYWPVVCDGSTNVMTIDFAKQIEVLPITNKIPTGDVSVSWGGPETVTTALKGSVVTLTFSANPSGTYNLYVSLGF